MDRRGQARLVEGLAAIVILALGAAVACHSAGYALSPQPRPMGLADRASSTLHQLLRAGLLEEAIYTGDLQILKGELDRALLREGLGYRLEVYDSSWSLLACLESGFKPSAAYSAYAVVFGRDGSYPAEVRVVVLSVSG